jgi:hypothetical protein
MRPGLPDPLIALLGARWAMGAPVVGAAWFGHGGHAAFALADGSIATAPSQWEGAARLQPRDGGGVELVPAHDAPPPVMRAGVHQAPCLALAGYGTGDVFSGGGDGLLARIAADGTVGVIAQFPGMPIQHVAAGPLDRFACAVGNTVHRFDDMSGQLDVPATVTALAYDPTGRHLAIGLADRVTVWSGEKTHDLPCAGTPVALSWAPDSGFLVAGSDSGRAYAWTWSDGVEIALGDTPAAPMSLSFSPAGRLLATSGGTRVTCWHLESPRGRRRDCGVASTAPVTRVAAHPWRTLIAAGYDNGAVLLCQPDSTDILFVRAAGGGAISALIWSADGASLAIGTAGGEIGVVAFPDLLFRSAAGQMQEAS